MHVKMCNRRMRGRMKSEEQHFVVLGFLTFVKPFRQLLSGGADFFHCSIEFANQIRFMRYKTIPHDFGTVFHIFVYASYDIVCGLRSTPKTTKVSHHFLDNVRIMEHDSIVN